MDKTTVYGKTTEGEEAVRERASLAQRNLRNILIMVDGHASAAELARRFGDEAAALAALAELESGGLIAVVGKAPPIPDAPPALPADGKDEETAIAPVPPQVMAPETSGTPSAGMPAPLTATPAWMDRLKARLTRRRQEGSAKRADGVITGVDLAPIRRRPPFLAWPWLAAYAVIGAAVLGGLTFALYPYSRHLPDIEKGASSMLGDPVRIGEISFSFLPSPHISLSGITVGEEAHLSIATAQAAPDFLSLFGEKMILHELVLDKVVVRRAGLSRLAQAGAAPAEIRRLAFQGLSLELGTARIDDMSGEARMTAAGAIEQIRLRNADGTFKLDMRPAGEAFRLTFVGNDWKTPFAPNLKFRWIEGEGALRSSGLELGKIAGKAYEGLIEGRATLGWDDGLALAGEFELKRMEAAGLLEALGSAIAAEGELTVRLKLVARTDDFGKMNEALRAEGTFDLKRGAAIGFDVGEAARSRAPTRGGETKFEQLSGDFRIDAEKRRIENIRLGSGLLRAGGNLAIDREGRLDGMLDIELKGTTATQKVSLTIAGTARDPQLAPGRGK